MINLNTSNVIIQLTALISKYKRFMHLNTSNVIIQQKDWKNIKDVFLFKYI